ncbi:MAG: S41 family peptidase [Candidatus Cloacimonetes bacterium]|nr:S41 family peptidase [Candidatus Cloacimonadota bacterium]
MKFTTKKSIIIILILSLFIGFFAGRITDASARDTKSLYSYMQLFTQVLKVIEDSYVDTLAPKDMILNSINGMIDESMDPFTTLMTPEDFEELRTSTKGKFGGLGIRISSPGDYITINSVIEGTPASQVGLIAGDKVIAVDGKSTKDWTTKKAAENMRGPKDSKVIVTVRREGIDEDIDFEVTRDIVKIKSIPYVYKIKDDIGYIRIVNFNSDTGRDLQNSLEELKKQGIEGLIIDVRSNPGGLLSQAIETVDHFLPKSELVVYTQGRKNKFNREYYTENNYEFNDIPIVVLVNQATASAAEIFSGSLQDYDKALVVGKNSFGKGSVQQLFRLPLNYGIKVTTSKYYIKSGRCIHKDRNKEAEEDSVQIDLKTRKEKHKYYTNNGRVVYGGGGITPDIIIEQDTLNKFEIKVRSKNLFFKYAVDYLADHEIDNDFNVTPEIFSDFVNYIDENDIEYTEAQFAEGKNWLKNSLEAQIMSNKFGMEAGNKISVRMDPQLQNAVQLLEKYNSAEKLFDFAANHDSLNVEDL